MTWLVFAGMAAAVTVALLYPVLRPAARRRREAFDAEVFKAQLREIELDTERGTLPPEEADAAKLEIQRRLLRADQVLETGAEHMSDDKQQRQPTNLQVGARRLLVPVVIVTVLFGSFILYSQLGSPRLPDMPLDDRQEAAENLAPERVTIELAELEEKLAARLEEEPDDGDGWRLLGRTRQELGRYGEAADAYARAAEIHTEDGALWAYIGENLVFAEQGNVSARARSAFEAALKLDPEIPAARYYLGLALFQAGDFQQAYDRWLVLAQAADPEAPWLPDLQKDLNLAAESAGIEPTQVVTTTAPPGPTAQDMAAADELSDEDRAAFVASMVERLEQKLEDDPTDVDGWMRLGRAKTVLGDFAAAADAYGRAAKLQPSDLDTQLANAHAHLRTGPKGSRVPDPVLAEFGKVHALDPENFDGLWFTGLKHLQDGNQDQALEQWQRALDGLGPDDPRRALVEQQLNGIARR